MKILLIALLSLNAAPARAAGATGADVLRFGSSPRAFAMAEAMSAVPDGPFSLHSNPAALTKMQYPELDLLYNRWSEGVTYQSLLYGRPARFGTLAAGVQRLGVDNFPGYNAAGQAVEKVSAEEFVYGAGCGLPVFSGSRSLSLGIGIKGIESRLERARARGYAADLGALGGWNLSWAKLSAGLAVQNLGTGLKYDSEKTPLPASYRLGLAVERRVYGDPFTVALDLAKSRADARRLKVAVGFEAGISGVLFPRIGLRSPDDLGSGLSFGLGVKIKNARLDYGLAILGGFGPAHRFGLSFTWGEPIAVARTQDNLKIAEAHRRLGEQFMRSRRYLDAVAELSKALEYDPTNREILQQLKEAYDAMR